MMGAQMGESSVLRTVVSREHQWAARWGPAVAGEAAKRMAVKRASTMAASRGPWKAGETDWMTAESLGCLKAPCLVASTATPKADCLAPCWEPSKAATSESR